MLTGSHETNPVDAPNPPRAGKVARACSFRAHAAFLPPGRTRHGLKYSAVFMKGVAWKRGETVTIAFMDGGRANGVKYDPEYLELGDPIERELPHLSPAAMVRRVVEKRIAPFVDLNFSFIDDVRNADVRISFSSDSGGAWSVLGNAARYDVPPDEATMNFGWLNSVVITHEFGHFLGMAHEHSNPRGEPIIWDREYVLQWARETQGWDDETTERNILRPLDVGSTNGSAFDKKSVMLYSFSREFTKCKCFERQWNVAFSETDVEWIVRHYKPEGTDWRKLYRQVYGGAEPSSAVTTAATAAAGSGSATLPPSNQPTNSPSIFPPKGKMDSRAVAGIAAGCVLLLILLFYFFMSKG